MVGKLQWLARKKNYFIKKQRKKSFLEIKI